MLIVLIGKKKIEQVLKELRKKVERTKQTEKLRERKTYTKPSQRRRDEINAAKYKQSKFGDSKY